MVWPFSNHSFSPRLARQKQLLNYFNNFSILGRRTGDAWREIYNFLLRQYYYYNDNNSLIFSPHVLILTCWTLFVNIQLATWPTYALFMCPLLWWYLYFNFLIVYFTVAFGFILRNGNATKLLYLWRMHCNFLLKQKGAL